MSISILFVDDEPNVISGLKRMLFSMRKEWKISYASSGIEALKKMDSSEIDVIVTDMRMPQMDGAQLLERVKDKFPSAIRIILSGHSDNEMAIRSSNVAHQFIAKPCDADTLKKKISKTLKLREFLSDKGLIQMINGIGELPSLPDTYLQLNKELKKEDVSIGNIGNIISKDIPMSAKILQLVNSAFFGLPTKITNPNQAVNLLGISIIKSLILYVSTFGNPKIPEKAKFYLDTLWEHSFMVGNICKKIAQHENLGKELIDDAYTAGILHDIGKLILLKNENYYDYVFSFMEEENINIVQAEKQLFGASHSEIGGYLLGIWGLPDSIVGAVVFHHTPDEIIDNEFSISPILYLANKLSILKITKEIYLPNLSLEETEIDLDFISKYFSSQKIYSIINSIK